MKKLTTWSPLLLVGLVLIANACVFLVMALSVPMNQFFGVAIVCLGSGIALTIAGATKMKRPKTR